jgi:hypothetical protein
MPTWVMALQLALGLLQDIVPLIEETVTAVTNSGGDPIPHVKALGALSNSITSLSQAVTAAQAKP